MSPRLRYTAYAGLLLGGGALYVGLDDAPEAAPEPSRGAVALAPLALPRLRLAAAPVSAETARDLFAVVRPPPPAPPPPQPVAVSPPPPPPPPDRFEAVRVVGTVGQDGETIVLVDTGDGVELIKLGESFGAERALVIDTIGADSVMIVDRVSNVTKMFLLNEG